MESATNTASIFDDFLKFVTAASKRSFSFYERCTHLETVKHAGSSYK